MNICMCFSPNWAQYVEVEVYALFSTNKPPIKVYLVTDYLDMAPFDRIKSRFGNGYEIEYINIDPLFNQLVTSQLNVSSRFTKYTLYRLVLPKVIKADKLLYIDADALVNGDLRKMYGIDMGNNLLAGCIDTGIYEERYRHMLFNIGLTMNDPYINAGVVLFNWSMISEELCNEWIHEVNTKAYGCHDQDILNKSCKGKIITIENKYNSSLSTGFADNPIICHYAGLSHEKPWTGSTAIPGYGVWRKWELEYKERANK